jgi:hypothetical protein
MIEVVYDSILVIVKRLIKYTILIPYKELSSAIDLAYIFLKYVIANYKILEEIVSNRDKLFISKF